MLYVRLFCAIVAVLAFVGSPNIAEALSASITEFAVPVTNAHPLGITRGPDGNIWFTEALGNSIDRITPTGTITRFPVPTLSSGPLGITEGPDGNLWFTEAIANKIGRVTTAGVINELAIPTSAANPNCVGLFTEFPTKTYGPVHIATGPDGNLWFTDCETNSVGRVTPTGTFSAFMIPIPNSVPLAIIASKRDGNMWFTQLGSSQIGAVTLTGGFSEFSIPSNVVAFNIASNPAGGSWFTQLSSNSIGKITASGSVTEVTIPFNNGAPNGIAFGADGAFWFTYQSPSQANIGRVTIAGAFTEFPFASSGRMRRIETGPDANLWFTESEANKIGRVHPSTGLGSWQAKAPMPTARSGAAVSSINGILYVVGGIQGPPTKFLKTNEMYNPSTNTWTPRTSMPTGRELNGTNGATVGGKMYVIGGNANGSCTSANEAYDPVTNAWSSRAPMPTPRCHLAVVALNNLIYAIGGTNTRGTNFATVEIYNPSTNSWSTGVPMLAPRSAMGAVVSSSGQIIVLAGNSAGTLQNTILIFDRVTNHWTTANPLDDLPTLRSSPGAAGPALKSRIYAFGGTNSGAILSTVDAHDDVLNTWIPRAPMPTARAAPGVGIVRGVIYVIGGGNSVSQLNTNEAFTDQ